MVDQNLTEPPEESSEQDRKWLEIPASDSRDPAHVSPPDSPQLSPTAADSDSANRAAVPVLKRRRVTRACDECRRKKIKCDGKQPCTHCTVYSYECTYDQPSNRRRNAAPQYIEALENQLKRADAILKMIIPNADLSDPNLEDKLRSGMLGSPLSAGSPETKGVLHEKDQYDTNLDSQLESMVRSTGQLDLDEQGNLEYHGHSSGLSFVRRMREQLGDVMGPEGRATPFVKSRPLSQVFDTPRCASESPFDSGVGADLPSREEAYALCDNAVNTIGPLIRFVHWPTFVKELNAIYEKPPEAYSNDENTFLPLLYAAMALGSLVAKGSGGGVDKNDYENAISKGFKYFRASRQLMDIADCRDLRQVQAVLFMILFLQSSAKLSTCYAYIGVALRSALRMGLHRSFPESFNPIIAETRKRVFWTARKMDIYVGALLGLPLSLNDEDIDQEFPAESDDEYITEDGILPMPEGKISVMAASNAHTTLVAILSKIVKYVYPLKASHPSAQEKALKTYSVSYGKIVEIERELQDWQDKLPLELKPGGDAPRIIMRVQHLLRISYAHAQMMLYRPFLHYVSHTKSRVVDKRSYACAAACVSVSRNIIHIAVEMNKRKLLASAYWFTIYTTFFAILSLVFYALENPENDASRDVLLVAKEGKDTLAALSKQSLAADRCTATLAALFEQLPDRLSRTRRKSSANKKKRRQESSPFPMVAKPDPHSSEVDPRGDCPSKQPRRAHTYAEGSTDVKPALGFGHAQQLPQTHGLDTYPLTGSHGFSDASPQPSPDTTDGTSSLGQISRQDSFPVSPTTFPDSSFPLADLSAMMFPSSDPFAYPNQPVAPVQYEQFQSNQGGCSFPYPSSQDAVQSAQSAENASIGFVPPSSAFMLSTPGFGGEGVPGGDTDVQLLGPLPPYAMQSYPDPLTQQPATRPFAPTQHIDVQDHNANQTQLLRSHMAYSAVPNLNLNELLGGEEWAGPLDSGFGSFVNPAVGARDGPFKPKVQQFATSTDEKDASSAMESTVTFDDLSPGTLGWGLGY